MALLGDPELLALDEPINGLDPEGYSQGIFAVECSTIPLLSLASLNKVPLNHASNPLRSVKLQYCTEGLDAAAMTLIKLLLKII